MTSDYLTQLTPDRMSLWKMLLSDTNQSCSYPRLGRDDIVYVPYSAGDGQPPVPIAFSEPVIVQVRSLAAGGWMVHILNTSDGSLSRNYALADLGIAGPQYVWDSWQMTSIVRGDDSTGSHPGRPQQRLVVSVAPTCQFGSG